MAAVVRSHWQALRPEHGHHCQRAKLDTTTDPTAKQAPTAGQGMAAVVRLNWQALRPEHGHHRQRAKLDTTPTDSEATTDTGQGMAAVVRSHWQRPDRRDRGVQISKQFISEQRSRRRQARRQ